MQRLAMSFLHENLNLQRRYPKFNSLQVKDPLSARNSAFCVTDRRSIHFGLFLDGSHIALGCHDNDVYIYELQNGGTSVSLKARCKVMK